MANLQVPWFESPLFHAELERSSLDATRKARVQQYAEDGYVQFHLDLPDFDEIADTIVSTLAPEHQVGGPRLQDAWRRCDAVRELASAEEVITTLRDLYAREPIPFQTLNFRRGSEQHIHSDLAHFASMPQHFMAGVWIALEDVSEEIGNGPLVYYPGSHRLPTIQPHDLGEGGGYRGAAARYAAYASYIQEVVEELHLRPKVIDAKRGDVLIWAANMLHGGLRIARPETTRNTQVTHYFFEGCRYYTPMNSHPALPAYWWRRVTDVRDGRVVPHMVDGRRVRLPLQTRVRHAAAAVVRDSRWGRHLVERVRQRVRAG